MLELLLFYAIPRRDTNKLAHRLIRRYGSISGVFDADADELIHGAGLSENTAARAFYRRRPHLYPLLFISGRLLTDLHK